MTWYFKLGSMGQALVIDEADGRTVAVAYDEKDAALLTAAPTLLAALKEAERVIRWAAQEAAGRVDKEKVSGWLHHANLARRAINDSRVLPRSF